MEVFCELSDKKCKLVQQPNLLIAELHREYFQNNFLKFCLEVCAFAVEQEFLLDDICRKEMESSSVQQRSCDPLQVIYHDSRDNPDIKELEDHLFRDETKYNYRVRYALAQKGRLLVQRFYRKLD